MKKYTFRIGGDNAEGYDILLECTFYAPDDFDLNGFRDMITDAYGNPQRVGAPISISEIEEI